MVKELLRKLSDAHGVSSSEGNIRDIVRAELAGVVDELREDTMGGNLIAVKRGDDFSVMLAAHMDEIGLMVQYIDEKGFIRVVPIGGGWFGPVLYCQRVILHGKKGPVMGVLGAKPPPHVMKEEERKKEIKIENMFVDVGATSEEEVKGLGIEIGTPITIDREYTELAGTRVTGKALDNRVASRCSSGRCSRRSRPPTRSTLSLPSRRSWGG